MFTVPCEQSPWFEYEIVQTQQYTQQSNLHDHFNVFCLKMKIDYNVCFILIDIHFQTYIHHRTKLDMINSSKNISTYRISHVQKEFINIQSLVNQCKKLNIKCQKLFRSELQQALGVVAMRAFREKNKNSKLLFVFFSQVKGNTIEALVFYDGKQVMKSNIENQKEASSIIANSLDKIQSRPEVVALKHYNHKHNEQKVQNLYQKLVDKSSLIAKNQKNQQIAIQQLKFCPQYQNILNYLKQMMLDLQEICNQSQSIQSYLNKKSSILLDLIDLLQLQKDQLDQKIMEYDNVKRQSLNVRGRLDDFIANERDKVEKMDFYDEESFNRYMESLKKLKTLEYHRKFLTQ